MNDENKACKGKEQATGFPFHAWATRYQLLLSHLCANPGLCLGCSDLNTTQRDQKERKAKSSGHCPSFVVQESILVLSFFPVSSPL